MISRRYFEGEDILYPDMRRHLSWCLRTLANPVDSYVDFILESHYQDRKLRDYVLTLLKEDGDGEAGDPLAESATMPDNAPRVEAMVKEWRLMAQSDTLETMDEREAADYLARRVAVYTASTRRVRRLLPHPAMNPIEMFPGRCMVAFTAYEYRKTDIGPYNEFSILNDG